MSEQDLGQRRILEVSANVMPSKTEDGFVAHTRGPWRVHPYLSQHGPYNKARDVGPSGRAVAVVIGEFEKPTMGDEQEANARLIAAAPDLLAALKKVVAIADRKTVEFDEARAAISKAEGISHV